MNSVPYRYRNVVNPWQTPREIRNAVKFIEKMLAKLSMNEDEKNKMLRANEEDRSW